VDLGVDPLDAYLVVADATRTEKTICLAVSPALKAFGVPGRARLFEAVSHVAEVNRTRLKALQTAQNRNPADYSAEAVREAEQKARYEFSGASGQVVTTYCKLTESGELGEDRASRRVTEIAAEARNGKGGQDAAQAKTVRFNGSTCFDRELKQDPELELDFIIARPRMHRYMDVSSKIFSIYLRYVAPEDMHVYSVDEVFIDATDYLKLYRKNIREFTEMLVHAVQDETGITSTAGIGTNMYLAKIAMDIEAKHMAPDSKGVRIAALDEQSYREKYWTHRPLTDFWRVGPGYARRLENAGLYTMGDIARQSVYGEEKLYKMFGVAAELLIDHAWGWEPCTIAEIQAYRPESKSLSSGQVLSRPYTYAEAETVVTEMAELLALDMVDKCLETDQLWLSVGYDTENIEKFGTNVAFRANPDGSSEGMVIEADRYGRKVPSSTRGTVNIGEYTNSSRQITDCIRELFERVAIPEYTVRRMYISANRLIPEQEAEQRRQAAAGTEQLSLFTDIEAEDRERREREEARHKEKSMQKAMLDIKKRFGSNAIIRGVDLEEGATTLERNGQVGGHRG